MRKLKRDQKHPSSGKKGKTAGSPGAPKEHRGKTMLQAMLAGVASIKAQQTRMNVIGNNLANVNTNAFKSGRVTFQDMMSLTMRGAARPGERIGGMNPVQYGLGVRVTGTDTNHEQGSLQSTNRPTDLAVQGGGFFVVSDGANNFYTRDGGFDLDANGDLVHRATGQRLTGWTADSATGTIDTSVPITPSTTLNIPLGLRTALQQTTNMGWNGNLSSGAVVGTNASSQIDVFDSLGATHKVKITFTKTADNEWSWNASGEASATVTGSGTITFSDANGSIVTGGSGSIVVDPVGSGLNLNIAVDFAKLNQTSGASSLTGTQNGFPPGSLEKFSIGSDGIITGIYSNTMNRPLGQIALAAFANPGGLERQGSNLFRATENSGDPSVGLAINNGRGQIISGYLEQSNVDIGQEFTDLIITQRGFQANTKVVTTVDEMLQELINMKR